MNEDLSRDDGHRDPTVPAYFGLKLTVTASLGWVCAWLFLPGSFAVWLILVGVYSALLASFGLAGALGYRGSVAHRVRSRAFFRTSGWLIMSGVLSVVLLILYAVILVLVGRDPFPR